MKLWTRCRFITTDNKIVVCSRYHVLWTRCCFTTTDDEIVVRSRYHVL